MKSRIKTLTNNALISDYSKFDAKNSTKISFTNKQRSLSINLNQTESAFYNKQIFSTVKDKNKLAQYEIKYKPILKDVSFFNRLLLKETEPESPDQESQRQKEKKRETQTIIN